MNASLVLKVGVFFAENVIPKCVLNLKQLWSNEYCRDLLPTSDLLGKALSIAGIPYEIVPINGFDGWGSFNETTGSWTGTGLF